MVALVKTNVARLLPTAWRRWAGPRAGSVVAADRHRVGWVYYLMGRNDEAAAHIRRLWRSTRTMPRRIAGWGWFRSSSAATPRSSPRSGGRSIWPRSILMPPACLQWPMRCRESERGGGYDHLKRRSAGGELVPPFFHRRGVCRGGGCDEGDRVASRGIDQKDIYIPENFFEPLLDPLRKDPRFEQIVTRIGAIDRYLPHHFNGTLEIIC